MKMGLIDQHSAVLSPNSDSAGRRAVCSRLQCPTAREMAARTTALTMSCRNVDTYTSRPCTARLLDA